MCSLFKTLSILALSSLMFACGGGVAINTDKQVTDEDNATVLLLGDSSPELAEATGAGGDFGDADEAIEAIEAIEVIEANDADAEDSASTPVANSEPIPNGEQTPADRTAEVSEQDRQFTPADITDLILVTGQSNALGAQTAFDASLDSPHEQVFAFTDQGWQQADLHQVWDLGNFPRGNPGEAPNNNLALHMAKEIARQRGDRVVGFVLATAPGQSITHWSPAGGFFRQIDSKVLQAINQLPHKSQLDGILWHQGESDEGDLDYHLKLDSLIENFRTQSWFSSDRPFICGETAVFEVVNRQLNALNSNGDRWSGCVGSENLSTHLDGFHFNAEGLRELGRRYGAKYLQMTAG